MNASGARQNVAENGPVRPAGRATTTVSMTGLRGFETGIALRKTHPGHYSRCNVSHLTRFRNTTESEGSSSTRAQNQAQAAPSSQPGQGQSQPAATYNVTTTSASTAPAKANGLHSSDYYLQLAERLLVTTKPASTQKAKAQSQYGVPVTYFLEKLLFHRANNAPGNALAYVDNDRWLSIIALYEEEIGIQYPFLNLDELRREITQGDVRNAKDDHSRQSKPPPGTKASRIQIENIAIHLLAIISIFADARTIEIANPWVEEIYAGTVARTQLDSTVNAADLCLLILAVSLKQLERSLNMRKV